MQITTISLAAATGLAVLVACAPVSMPEPSEGRAFFAQNCAACHGPAGRGDGSLSGDLNPKPTDLTVLARGNGGTFPTARALSYIWGDPTDNHLIRVMPEFGPAMADDLVPLEVDGVMTPTPRALAALLSYLESIQR
ncbi:cytochrome c4 [Sulfitobacter geojensis]|jgi:mono/diheme cytochrome c family protein|uniref:cytochrome c4 n=1 Tax=Sulfitobacter geojensis TaxID=1342299 RepID=UPI00046A1E69|nr:c-type cytochrome [Sulfitobacter geojensis]KHA53007.1 Cytochrome c family protein [Sulfitobacter geojensis]NYI28340.1 mono/diheme cytochrome c family protein [Sulfitobacter geojensis]